MNVISELNKEVKINVANHVIITFALTTFSQIYRDKIIPLILQSEFKYT